jgi:hypothetical protein
MENSQLVVKTDISAGTIDVYSTNGIIPRSALRSIRLPLEITAAPHHEAGTSKKTKQKMLTQTEAFIKQQILANLNSPDLFVAVQKPLPKRFYP